MPNPFNIEVRKGVKCIYKILYTLLLRKRVIPPKRRSLQSFLKLKKSVFHMPISLSLFLFIYIDLDSAY